MKKIIIASGLLALMGATTSCDKYDIYPEQYGDVTMIKNAGEKEVTVYATDDAAEYNITVMKGGHTPENVANVQLRVMNDADFKAYKANLYGDPDFPGLEVLDPSFYTFVDGNGNECPNRELNYTFSDPDVRYFTAKLLLNAQLISDWRAEKESTEEGKLELNAKKFVIPVGLYSATDSINADNNFIMLEPAVTDPVMNVGVEYGGYELTQISRNDLIAGKLGAAVEPEVYLSVPCTNKYGFGVKFKGASQSAGLVNTFNTEHKNIQLTNEKNKDAFDFNGGENIVYFAPGVTKVRLPLSFYTEYINANDLASNVVRGFQLEPATNAKTGIDMVWDEAANVPEKVQKSLKLPTNPDNAAEAYKFFVGYKIVETPLELNDGCVSSNDCEPTEGSIAALFDDNLSTFFHSGWTVAFDRNATFGSYLEIEVPSTTPINACYFQFTSRVHANPASPQVVWLYYSNQDDPQLREADTEWHYFAKVELKKSLGSGETGELGSLDDMPKAPEDFKYLRFCVMKSNRGELTTPSVSIYWNLAELRMYGKHVDDAAAE